jgi:hypothetical protein
VAGKKMLEVGGTDLARDPGESYSDVILRLLSG